MDGQLDFGGQSYRDSTIVDYDPRVDIKVGNFIGSHRQYDSKSRNLLSYSLNKIDHRDKIRTHNFAIISSFQFDNF